MITPKTKTEWRSWAKKTASGVRSEAVAEHLGEWRPIHGVLASYLSMPGEIDLTSLHGLLRCRVLVSRASAEGSLTFHDLDRAGVERHPYGFLQPLPDAAVVDPRDIDVVLVPGLVFGRDGSRIGRGAGMYDRFLAALPSGVVRVGVTSDHTLVDAVPMASHDEWMHWVATESGVHRVGEAISQSTSVVVDRAIEVGIAPAMVRFPEGTKTSADAARAVGAELGSIAKSLVFLVDNRPVLVLCSGDHRVDEKRLAAVFDGVAAKPAPLETVRAATGFVAGGTPAVGHATDLEVVADASLARYRWLWSAGGTPDTVYPVSLERLIAGSGSTWVDVSIRG
jgi:5,10-methenyltetrahydrofolate synthetase